MTVKRENGEIYEAKVVPLSWAVLAMLANALLFGAGIGMAYQSLKTEAQSASVDAARAAQRVEVVNENVTQVLQRVSRIEGQIGPSHR